MIINNQGQTVQQIQSLIALAQGVGFLSGPVPASPADALTAENQLLGFWMPANPPVMSIQGDLIVATLTYPEAQSAQNQITFTAPGQITFARAISATAWDPALPSIFDFEVSSPWQPSAPVIAGQLVTSNGNLYQCVTGGVTSASTPLGGMGTAITDGTAVWAYMQAGTAGFNLPTVNVVAGQTVTLAAGQIMLPTDSQSNAAGPPAALVQQAIAAVPISSALAVMTAPAGLLPAQADDLADASAFLGIAAQSGVAGATINVVTAGFISDTSFAWALGSPIFVGENGRLTQTPPVSGISLIAGYPQDTSSMIVRPQLPTQL